MSEGAEKTTQDGPKTPKGPPKAPKMTPKGSKNDPKMTPKAQKTRPQSRRRNQLAPRRPKDFQCKIHLGAVRFFARSPVRSCVQCWAGLVGFALAYRIIFQDVRTSSEEMTSSDVKKVTKMDQKMGQNGPKCVHKSYFRTPNQCKWTHMGLFGALWGPFGPSGTP